MATDGLWSISVLRRAQWGWVFSGMFFSSHPDSQALPLKHTQEDFFSCVLANFNVVWALSGFPCSSQTLFYLLLSSKYNVQTEATYKFTPTPYTLGSCCQEDVKWDLGLSIWHNKVLRKPSLEVISSQYESVHNMRQSLLHYLVNPDPLVNSWRQQMFGNPWSVLRENSVFVMLHT